MALKDILTQERVNQLASSMTQKQAAAFLRVSHQHLSTTLKQLEFKWERALKYKLTQQKLDEMAQTMNQREAAVMMGVERPTLSAIIKKLGLKWRPINQRVKARPNGETLSLKCTE